MSDNRLPLMERKPQPPAESFAEVVYRQVRGEILAGILKPGDRIREAEVAARIGTSQGPVREALARLREQGFILSFPHRGSFVTMISEEEARDAYVIRGLLDRWVLQHALQVMGPEEFAILEANVKRMEEAASRGWMAENIALDMEFHRHIYEWSGSTTALQLWDVLELKIRSFAVVATPPVFSDHPLSAARSHYALIERMREGYSPELEAELDRHLGRIWTTSREKCPKNLA